MNPSKTGLPEHDELGPQASYPESLASLFDSGPHAVSLLRVRGERDEARAGRESALQALAFATCPYYLGTGACSQGCESEPACQTCEPEGGWVVAAFDALAPDEEAKS